MRYHTVNGEFLSKESRAFYLQVLELLNKSTVPFLVGGAYALKYYTGVERDTKDLDVFIRENDCPRFRELLQEHGFHMELTFTHWLGKVYCGEAYFDIIFNAGNGLCPVDDLWFTHAVPGTILGLPVHFCPIEETLWQKAFIMERERYDGSDVAHLLRAWGKELDWDRLLMRFGCHWRVLLCHLILFGYIYPSDKEQIPDHVLETLLARQFAEMRNRPPEDRICQGTFLSRSQYTIDLEEWKYKDGRIVPNGNMTASEAGNWTAAGEEINDPRTT